jgi:hypothetical protein
VNALHQFPGPTIDEADDVTRRLVTLAPTRPLRSANRLKVQTYLPAILTARKNGNSWAQIADIVGMKADALRKAVAHFTATGSQPVPTLSANKRTGDVSRSIDPRVTTGPRAAPTPSPATPAMHAGLRRKDARI